MADYFVASGGSNTSPYDTWAKAATSLATALAAAAADGDRVIIQHNAVPTGDAEVAADTTYTLAGNISVISASNDGGSAWTPTVMGTANWIGNSTTNRSITFNGAFRGYFYGLTLRTAGTTFDNINIANGSDGGAFELESCYLWQGNTGTGVTAIQLGSGTTGQNSYVRAINCTFRLGSTAQSIRCNQRVDILGGSLTSAGSSPTTLISISGGPGAGPTFTGVDFSHATSNIVGGATSSSVAVVFDRCSFGTGYTLLATQTPANKSSGSALALDCAVGDSHGIFQYADAYGSVVSDTGIYYTSGAAAQSWKIVTTANCSFATPFVTPPISLYNIGTSAITPYLEILRDGSTTAYDNDEVWAEFWAKTTSGSVVATEYSDRMALNGTPAAQAAGAGLGSWTGESGTAWSGKIDSGSAFTPAEVGDISVNVCVGLASATVYVDPQIRT